MNKFYGGIEAGGTKFVCMVGTDSGEVIDETRFPTTHPDQTIQQAIEFFSPYVDPAPPHSPHFSHASAAGTGEPQKWGDVRGGSRKELAAIGIASFGPVDLNPKSETYGYITTTPKPHWQQVDLCGRIRKAFNLPVAFDTDVNAAAFGEHYWTPQNKTLDPFVYMTIGTGIGVGVFANGAPVHGLVHTEAGHVFIPHNREKDPFPGICPFHGDCLEGLASGPAMNKRWGQSAETLPDDHPAWDLEAEYIALSLVNLIYTCSPQRIVLGGGVPQHPGLHEAVRKKVQQYSNGYVQSPMILEKIGEYIVPPTLGNRSGGLGAIALAIDLVDRQNRT